MLNSFFKAQLNSKTGLKKRFFLAAFTFLVALPGLLSIFFVHFSENSLFQPKIFAIMIGFEFFFRGILGLLGAIGLWRGTRWGYTFAITMWITLVLLSVVNISQVLLNNVTLQLIFLLSNNPHAQESFVVKAIGKIFWGLPIIFVLSRDLWKMKKYSHAQILSATSSGIRIFSKEFLLFVGIGIVVIIMSITWVLGKADTGIPENNILPPGNLEDREGETAGWKTYQNKEHGITFKFPPFLEDDTLFLDTPTRKTIVDLSSFQDAKGKTALNSIELVKYTYSAEDAISELEKIWPEKGPGKKFTLGNYTFHEFTLTDEQDEFDVYFYVNVPGKVKESFGFNMILNGDFNGVPLREVAKTILESVKFAK